MKRSFDIVIASHGVPTETPQHLARCLATIGAFTPLPHRVLVERSDDSAARNRNAGIAKSDAEFICFLDDDAWVTPGWCESLIAVLTSDPDCGMVGPKIKLENGRIFCAGIDYHPPDRFVPIAQNVPDEDFSPPLSEPFALPTTCLMVRRDVLLLAGPFDEGFESCQWEDLDFYLRLRLAGFRGRLDAAATVYHRNMFRSYHYDRNHKRFTERWLRYLSANARSTTCDDLA